MELTPSGLDTLRCGTRPATGENRTISGSPSGAPSPVSLSLRIKTLQQHRASDHADKGAKNGHSMSLRGGALPPKQSPVNRRLLRLRLAMTIYQISEDSLCVASSDISGRVTRHRLFSVA